VSAVDAGERQALIESYQREIESYLAAGDGVRGLSLLFDFVAEFAPNFDERVVRLAQTLPVTLRERPNRDNAAQLQEAVGPLLAQVLTFASPERFAMPEPPSQETAPPQEVPSFIALKKRLLGEAASDVVVRLDGVCRNMGSGRTRFKLGPISVEAARGEVIGLVGHNGSGKTTLLRVMAGELAATEGARSFPGLEGSTATALALMDWRRIRSKIAVVNPAPPVIRERLPTALTLTGIGFGAAAQDAHETARVSLHRFGLADHAEKRASDLSTGLRLRFEIARILMADPDLLILDEPLANLDAIAQQTLLFDLEMMAASVQRPRAVVISSQHIGEIEAISDRIIVLSQGQPLFIGKKDEIAGKLGVAVFEVVAENRRELVEAARLLGALEVIELGISVVLVCAQGVSRERLFAHLDAAKVNVTGFSDLSRSGKALLYIDRLVATGDISAGKTGIRQ
jgi:ABC-2 type transport system ATP-binding protein